MTSVWQWSVTAADNGTVGGVDIGEGCAPSNINNGIRNSMADVARLLLDTGGALVTTHTGNAFALATTGTLDALADGVSLAFVADAGNTGAATLNVNGIGATPVKKVTTAEVALASGDLVANGHYTVRYDESAASGAGAWILLNPSAGLDAELAAIAGLTSAADRLPYFTGSGTAALATFTAAGRALVDDADAAAQRATLGLGALAVLGTVNNGNWSGTGLTVANGGTGGSDAATARTNLAAATAAQTEEDWHGVILGAVANRDYVLVLKAKHAGTITEATTQSASGTCTATFKIGSTALGGGASAVSSAGQDKVHSSSNAFSAGDKIIVTVSSNSSCVDLAFSIKYTRTLA